MFFYLHAVCSRCVSNRANLFLSFSPPWSSSCPPSLHLKTDSSGSIMCFFSSWTDRLALLFVSPPCPRPPLHVHVSFVCLCCFFVWLRPPGRLDSPFLRQQHNLSSPPRGASPLRTSPHARTQPAAAAGRYSTGTVRKN